MSQSDDKAMKETEFVTSLIQIYEATKTRYYSSPPPTNADKNDATCRMFEKTRELFTSILMFEASAAHVLSLSTGKRAARAAFSWDDFETKTKDIRDLDQTCKRFQREFELKVQSTQWESSTRYLEEIAQNTRFLRELQEVKEQRASDEKLILSISTIPVDRIHSKLYQKQQHSIPTGVKIPKEYHCPKDWFLDDAMKWIDGKEDPRVFWLYGKCT